MQKLFDLTFEREAADKAVAAALLSFESACWRGTPQGMMKATRAVEVAIQTQMDAIASQIDATKQFARRGQE